MKDFFGQIIWYIRYHKRFVAFFTCSLGIFAVTFYLYGIPLKAVAYPAFVSFVVLCIFAAADFIRLLRRKKELERMCHMLEELPENYISGDDYLEKEYRKIIENLCFSLREVKNDYSIRYSTLMDYYTVWIHQIKTPISSMYLALSEEDTALSRRLTLELRKIEQYAEMVLTYLRLESEATDYVIKEYDIDEIITQTLKRLSGEFIYRRLALNYEKTEMKVVTDEKWLGFVVEQILTNALKYTEKGGIKIYAWEKGICIEDTGIGIAKEDVPRIFDRGYTGYNGRGNSKSTGIGLYLCKRICGKLGHNIFAESEAGKGTKMYLDLSRRHNTYE